ncbi:hypothetical protein [Pseudomonas lini]
MILIFGGSKSVKKPNQKIAAFGSSTGADEADKKIGMHKKAPRPNEARGKRIGWLRPTKGAL